MRAAVFDVYGTLLDLRSAVLRHAHRLGGKADAFAADWRAKQTEYAWVRSLAGQYVDFGRVTDDALAFAAARHGIADVALLSDLRDGYENLSPHPDSAPALRALRDKGVARVGLSNGTASMLGRQLRHAGLDELLDPVLSVDVVGAYKPHPSVYRQAESHVGLPPGEIGFVSSNPWDVFGAHSFGLRAIWVNRAAQPDEYGLRGHVYEVADLSALPALFD